MSWHFKKSYLCNVIQKSLPQISQIYADSHSVSQGNAQRQLNI